MHLLRQMHLYVGQAFKYTKITMNLLNFPLELLDYYIFPHCYLEIVKVCKFLNERHIYNLTKDIRCDPVANKHRLLLKVIKGGHLFGLQLCLADSRVNLSNLNRLQFIELPGSISNLTILELIFESLPDSLRNKFQLETSVKKIINEQMKNEQFKIFEFITSIPQSLKPYFTIEKVLKDIMHDIVENRRTSIIVDIINSSYDTIFWFHLHQLSVKKSISFMEIIINEYNSQALKLMMTNKHINFLVGKSSLSNKSIKLEYGDNEFPFHIMWRETYFHDYMKYISELIHCKKITYYTYFLLISLSRKKSIPIIPQDNIISMLERIRNHSGKY